LQDRHVTHFMSDFILLPAKLLIHIVRHYPHSIVLINRLVSHHCTIFFGLSAETVTFIKDAVICNMTESTSVSLVHGKFVVFLG